MFTPEEFDIMIDELLATPRSTAMLFTIVERFQSAVYAKCRADETLQGRNCEDEIMQIFRCKVEAGITVSFLRRDGVTSVNRDAVWFRRWLYRVAENAIRDEARRLRVQARHRTEEDPTVIPDEHNPFANLEQRETLQQSFALVFDTAAAPYKVLTWVAVNLLILEQNIDPKDAKKLVLKRFEDMTLADMLETVFRYGAQIPWLRLSEAHKRKWVDVLMTPLTVTEREDFGLPAADGPVLLGQVRYCDCFMAVGGVKNGTKSVSDWYYRMNQIVRGSKDEASND